jgi:hypothetical protein
MRKLRAAYAWIDELPDRYLHALITCCDLENPQTPSRDAALSTLRGTPRGRERLKHCKYKAFLPNFVQLVDQEGVRWYTSMQRDGKNRPSGYRSREAIRLDELEKEARRAERERTRERKQKARAGAARRRREEKAAASALRKEAARQTRREETAKRQAAKKAAAEHERRLRTLTGVRLQLYRKEHVSEARETPETPEERGQEAPAAKRRCLGIVIKPVGPGVEVDDFSDSEEE